MKRPRPDPESWYRCPHCEKDIAPDAVKVDPEHDFLIHSPGCGAGRVFKLEKPFVDLFEDLFEGSGG